MDSIPFASIRKRGYPIPKQAAGQDGIVGTVKGQDLLAAAVTQGGCPPGGGTGG